MLLQANGLLQVSPVVHMNNTLLWDNPLLLDVQQCIVIEIHDGQEYSDCYCDRNWRSIITICRTNWGALSVPACKQLLLKNPLLHCQFFQIGSDEKIWPRIDSLYFLLRVICWHWSAGDFKLMLAKTTNAAMKWRSGGLIKGPLILEEFNLREV